MIRTIKPKIVQPKIYFDAGNKKHLIAYAKFLKSTTWEDGCKFILEFPFSDIPTMINYKITERALDKYLK